MPRVGGGKIYTAHFTTFKQDFLGIKLLQKSNFRVQGMFFFDNCTSESLYYLANMPPRIHATISIINSLQYNFPKMRGGGSNTVWNFSKNSSDLVE